MDADQDATKERSGRAIEPCDAKAVAKKMAAGEIQNGRTNKERAKERCKEAGKTEMVKSAVDGIRAGKKKESGCKADEDNRNRCLRCKVEPSLRTLRKWLHCREMRETPNDPKLSDRGGLAR